MAEQQNHAAQAADESALTDESLESVAGGMDTLERSLIITPTVCPPPFGPVGPITEPILIDGTTIA